MNIPGRYRIEIYLIDRGIEFRASIPEKLLYEAAIRFLDTLVVPGTKSRVAATNDNVRSYSLSDREYELFKGFWRQVSNKKS